ncbi:putative HTH La-type RNA-binding protein [Yarrowia sp. C11]|nr:putative HTH La-type RNA-binding protein [Yarrowia sp. E02]KAG5373395.1 putative HTH La-type RNA-binding protein [Yarrowia sp. C11]
MSAPSYASVAKEDERVEGETHNVDKEDKAGSEPKTETAVEDKTSSTTTVSSEAEPVTPAVSSLTPAPPPKVNAWKIKSDTVAVAPPSFDDKRDTSPAAPKMKMGKGEKWVPYTPTLVMNGGKRGGRSKQGGQAQAPGQNGSQSSSGSQGSQPRRKSKPRAPHGDKKDASDSSAGAAAGASASGGSSDGGAEGAAGGLEKRKMRYNYRKNYYKNDFQPQGGAPGFYQPPGAYEYALSLIIGQVEYYFSVENLCKDLFMRKQMNSAGLVPLTLIAGFNRVKALAHDPAVFMQACRFAPSLQVVGDRIRLQQGWEQWVLPLEERDEAGKVEDVDPEAEAFPGLQLQQQQQAPVPQQQPSEPAKVSFDVANATPFVPKKQ